MKLLSLPFPGNCGDGFEYNETYSLFCITIVLTKQGFENRDKVLEAVFSYINMMKSQGPSERIYREIQKIEDLDFKFREERQPSDNVENLCENMLFYPPKLYLTGDDLMFDYDEKLIRDCTEMLKADKVNIFMMAREFLDECNETEPWFATEYKTEDIPEQSRQAWADAVPLPDMHLPEKNSFIAEDTSFKPIADGNPKYPVRIVDEPHGELFHRQDDIFKQPLAYIKFYLTSSASLQDVRSAVCLELFSGCISQTMVEETYPADLAQLSFFLSSAERGLLLKLSGLNDKLHFLLGVILDNVGKFEDLCTDEMFAAVRDQIKKNYYNHFIKPMKLVRDVRMSVIQDVYFQVTDKHAVVGDISKEEVVAFMKRFMAAAYLQGSVQGNMTREESKACYELFKSKLPFNPIQGEKPELRCKILPAGEKQAY